MFNDFMAGSIIGVFVVLTVIVADLIRFKKSPDARRSLPSSAVAIITQAIIVPILTVVILAAFGIKHTPVFILGEGPVILFGYSLVLLVRRALASRQSRQVNTVPSSTELQRRIDEKERELGIGKYAADGLGEQLDQAELNRLIGPADYAAMDLEEAIAEAERDRQRNKNS